MASNFSSLRSSRKSLLDKLAQQAKQESQKGGAADERFWKLTVDAKTKVGYAKLRFLPAPQNEELPWARVFSHGFEGPGGAWFIENCPTTLGRTCPVCAANSKLWKTGDKDNQSTVRERKRKLRFNSNVLILEDPAKPENVGKVFLFNYGAKIHDKIMELIEPQFPDQVPTNPFDLWEGADFKLKSRDVAGYQNYDKSEFTDPSELFNGDEKKQEAVWLQCHSLAAFTAENQFKSYEELEKRFDEVVSGRASRGAKTAEDAIKRETTADPSEADEIVEKVKEQADRKSTRRPAKPAPAPVADDPEDEDIRKFFGGLDDE